MKRVDLIKTILGMGCVLIRSGGKHDWFRILSQVQHRPVPRHREIKKHLAKQIIKMLDNPQTQ